MFAARGFYVIIPSCNTETGRNPTDQSFVPAQTSRGFRLPDITMITIGHKLDNPFSQDFYNDVISSLQLHQLKCSCGHSSCLSRHGSYFRTVKVGDSQFRLRVCRLRCRECGATHALMLSCMIPYSQVLLNDAASILLCSSKHNGFSAFLDGHLSMDENNIKAILRRYRRHWLQRLLAHGIPLFSLPELVSRCFQDFSRQFLQIKTTPNLLFGIPT